jgi:Membrane bound beta barrel domain (DUF5777)
MRIEKILFFTALLITFGYEAAAQDTTAIDLLAELDKETTDTDAAATKYVTATFKTTRLIGGHSSENVAKGVMDVKISHRFGTLNKGGYELFGLDNATMRMGVDYGITKYLMVGIGRSTYQKTYDAFFKLKILRQSTGKRNMPISLSYVPTIALKTLKNQNTEQNNYFSSKLFYTHQLIIARKFSDNLSLQLMPTFVHRNLVALAAEPNDILAIGIGGRQKLTKRVSINAEYYYLLPESKLNGTTNSLSIGFDIETGGHVFQLHFTNSQGMNERTFISETTGKWEKGDILFGFNISRVFTIGKNK